MTLRLLFAIALFFAATSNFFGQLLAFPTAEGAGRFTTGGRGTTVTAPTVYIVNTLVDNASSGTTPGTLRYACTNNSPAATNRIIVFRVSGTIRLSSALVLNRANTTIAGQTAPGDGICIADYPVTINATNIIIRYLRFRLGDRNQLKTTPAGCGLPTPPFASNPSCIPTANQSGNDDAFGDNGNGTTNVILDHCTASWSNDEAFTIYRGDNITVQWCYITEPLNYGYHVETGDTDYELHAFGGIWNGRHASFHHNLFAHIKGRAPRFDGIRNISADSSDFRNNVIYNWGDYNVNGGEGGTYNVVNNYYKYGPNTNSALIGNTGVNKRDMLINPYNKTTAPTIPYGRYYLTGNYCDNNAAVTANNKLGAAFNGVVSGANTDSANTYVVAVPFNNTAINMQSAVDAYASVLASGGASLPKRDTLDERIVNDVKNRTGKIIDCQGGFPHGTPFTNSQTAWPTFSAATAQTDTDADGMPNNWETARGLNISSATDRNGYSSTSGYNNLENYINGDTIVAVGIANTCIETKPITSTNSGNWIHARDSSFSGYLTTNYTSSVDSNHIVASILDDGNYGAFNVSYYTSSADRINAEGKHYARRNITITPVTPASITQPVTVRLYISKAEFDALKAADNSIVTINDLIIIKTTDNTCITTEPATYSTIAITNASTFGTYSNGYYVQFQTSSFSTFFLQSAASVAPVRYGYFTAVKENSNTAKLNWQTLQETNSKHFLVQRSSLINNNWSTIGTVQAAGVSSIPKQYSFTDNENKKGVYYYKLIQEDIDTRQHYTDIKKLVFANGFDFSIIPNPTSTDFQIYQIGNTGISQVVIYDASGKIVFQKRITNQIEKFSISYFKYGMYSVKIINNNTTQTKKLVIH